MSGILAAMPGIVTSGGAPPSGPPFSYDFTGANNDPWDAAKWTNISGIVNIQSNQGNFGTGGFATLDCDMYTGGQCNTVNQYQKMGLPAYTTSSFLQIVFRFTNSGTAFYVMEFNPGAEGFKWLYYANQTDFIAGSSITVQTSGAIGGWTPGDTVGVTLTGTGTGTEFRIWRNPTGDAPTSASVWGGVGPGITMNNDPATPVNTGTGLGLGMFQNTANSVKIDNWFGGDI